MYVEQYQRIAKHILDHKALVQVANIFNQNDEVRECVIYAVSYSENSLPDLGKEIVKELRNNFWFKILPEFFPNQTSIENFLMGMPESYLENFQSAIGSHHPLMVIKQTNQTCVITFDYEQDHPHFPIHILSADGKVKNVVTGSQTIHCALDQCESLKSL